MPKRIQRKRTKGWRMPKGAAYVGRKTEWGNPYVLGAVCAYHRFGIRVELSVESRLHAVQLFERWVARDPLVPRSDWNVHTDAPTIDRIRAELAGKDLACWCPLDQPCHADVLLRIANEVLSDHAETCEVTP